MHPTIHLGQRAIGYGPRKVQWPLNDKRRHLLVSGASGTGKSTLLANLFVQEANAGRGVLLIDPHGELAETCLDLVPSRRIRKTIYFNPADHEWPISFNVLDNIPPSQRAARTADIVAAFRSIWGSSWGPRLEHILYNSIAALMEINGTTLLALPKLLLNKSYRESITRRLQDPTVVQFWRDEFPLYEKKFGVEATAPVLNKIGQLLASPVMRKILGQPKSRIQPRHLIDNNYIVIANLSKGMLGEQHANLLGSLLITAFGAAAMSRADIKPEERKDFALIIDEFPNYTTNAFAALLSEARKYGLSLTLAHQYLEQMSEETRAAVLGNVGSIIAFRVGPNDGPTFARQLSPVSPEQLATTANYHAWCSLMLHGTKTEPTLIATREPPKPHGHEHKIIPHSRIHFATLGKKVDDQIARFFRTMKEPVADDPGW